MPKEPGAKAMHVAINQSRRVNKAGVEVVYQSALARRTYRQDGKVRNETLGNVSFLPMHTIMDLEASLAGKTMVEADTRFELLRTLPHGHVDAVYAMARGLRFESLLGPACRNRDLAMALLAARSATRNPSSPP